MAKTFFVTLRQLVVPAGVRPAQLTLRAAARLGIDREDIISCQPVRRSLDARKRRGRAVEVYHLRLELPNRLRGQLRKMPGLDLVFEKGGHHIELSLTDPAPVPSRPRPVVVGAGPAGLFAALRLARAGWKPLLVERGDGMAARRGKVAAFWRSGQLDPESNALFGVGGAGLFSDGKLNTRHKDRAGLDTILRLLVEAGAPESIRVEASPHVGSDLLGEVVERLLLDIEEAGGEVRTGCRLDGIHVEAERLVGLTLASGPVEENIEVDACVLATGHSARDVYRQLFRCGFNLAAKPFAIGLRVEMSQSQVDASQRGGSFQPSAGEAASFRLSRAPQNGAAACYTFCMCPGGQVIACASEPEKLCVNGMSFHARAGEWANAAFLSPVTEEDFLPHCKNGEDALAGIEFQRYWEQKAYRAGLASGPYAVPAAFLDDFVAARIGPAPEGRSVDRVVAANLRGLLPPRIGDTLVEAIPAMVSRLRKVDLSSVALYGVETRTSSPVRIIRNKTGTAEGAHGLFPAGEGSGYAGGIMTSALDGWRAAGCLMEQVRT